MILCCFLSPVLQTGSENLVVVSMLAVLLLDLTELSISTQFLFSLSNLVFPEHTTKDYGVQAGRCKETMPKSGRIHPVLACVLFSLLWPLADP